MNGTMQVLRVLALMFTIMFMIQLAVNMLCKVVYLCYRHESLWLSRVFTTTLLPYTTMEILDYTVLSYLTAKIKSHEYITTVEPPVISSIVKLGLIALVLISAALVYVFYSYL